MQSLFSLKGKNALVVGGAKGIGRGCVDVFLEAGVDKLAVIDSEGIKEEKIISLEGDFFNPHERVHCLREATRILGQIDTAVAGPAYSYRASFLDFPLWEFERVIDCDLISYFHFTHLLSHHMKKENVAGSIILISSICSRVDRPLSVAYDVSKAGIDKLIRIAALELAPYAIRVNAIHPGWIDTPGERLYASEKEIQEECKRLSLKRLGSPREIGQMALAVATNPYMTGSVVAVDGGYSFKNAH